MSTTLGNYACFATIFVAISIILQSSGMADNHFIYDRDGTYQYWRLITASVVHYDVLHLASNLSAFLLLSFYVKSFVPRVQLGLFLICVMLVTVFFLHFFLDSYQRFAGASCLNYAMLGLLMGHFFSRYRRSVLLVCLILLSYEYTVLHGNIMYGAPVPAWELHLLAFSMGSVYQLSRWLRFRG